MRAAGYLLIYNLVEASARGLGEAVNDAVRRDQLALKDVSPALRLEYFRQAERKKQGEKKDLIRELDNPLIDITRYYDASEIFAGNVDARRIRERLEELGCPPVQFSFDTTPLRNLKKTRNDLAHGHVSFETIGASKDTSDLTKTFACSYWTLSAAFRSLESMIVGQGYFSPNFQPVPVQ